MASEEEFLWLRYIIGERERASGRSHLTGFESQTLLPCTKVMLYEVRCLKSNEDMILALAGQFKLSYYIPFTGKHEPNKLTGSQLCDLIAQLARALHRHHRGHGFESRWDTWRQLRKLSRKCEDHIFIWFQNTALHITFLSYDIPFTGKHEPNKLTCSQLVTS